MPLAKLPAEAVTASIVLLSILLSSGAAFAQHVETGQDPRLQLTSPEAREVGPQAGVLVRRLFEAAGWAVLPAVIARSSAAKIDQMLKEGQDAERRFSIRTSTTYGGNQVLSEPPNSGSGRVVWAMPVVVGIGGFLTAAFFAMRWSRRPQLAGMPAGVEDPEMAARLDDELRNLD